MVDGLKPLGTQFVGDADSELQQRADKRFSAQIESNPTLDGRLIEGVSLSAGDNTINHLLGRAIRGWKVCRRYAAGGAASVKTEIGGAFDFNAGVAPFPTRGDTAEFAVTRVALGQYRLTMTNQIASFSDILLSVQLNAPIAAGYIFSSTPLVAGPPTTIDIMAYDTAVAGVFDPPALTWCNFRIAKYAAPNPGSGQIYDKQENNNSPDKTLVLSASVDCKVDLWVF